MASRHAKLVDANAALVRHVVDWLVAEDIRPRQRKCERALRIVEHWVAGEDVDTVELRGVSAQTRAEAKRLGDRSSRSSGSRGFAAWACACNAVAALATMAVKGKRWELEHDAILQSCVFAIFRTDSTGKLANRRKIHRRLDRRRKAAMKERGAEAREPSTTKAAKTKTKTRTKTKKRKGEPIVPNPTVAPTGLSRLGRVVAARLERIGAPVDPRLSGDPAALRALISRVPRPVREFDACYGGLVVPDGDGSFWVLGAFANLSLGVELVTEPRRLVPVASGGDAIAYMTTVGSVWAQDMVVDPEPHPFAASGDMLVARRALLDMDWEHVLARRSCRLAGKRGARTARALGLSLVRKASDGTWRVWADASHVVTQSLDVDTGEVWTTVAGPDARRFAER